MNFYCVNIVCIYHTCNKWKKILPFVHSKGKQQFEFEYKALCCVFWQANGYSTLNLDQARACGAPVCWSKYTTALLPHITGSQGQPEGGKLLVIRQLVVLNIYVQRTKNNQVRHSGHISVVNASITVICSTCIYRDPRLSAKYCFYALNIVPGNSLYKEFPDIRVTIWILSWW